ncbi:hypothetical protein [Cedecea lapagei]|uniref:hypothetical protein n=1 Tax=Cedecea lapagei TaxID=158823 RepID=UPI000F8270BE|nr:hypothetical protein [Cedecea lapagei]
MAILPLGIRPQDWGIIAKRVKCKQSEGNGAATTNNGEKPQITAYEKKKGASPCRRAPFSSTA